MVIALIVSPILAIIAYFAVDHLLSETPASAIAGQHYPLVAKSNCRYASGQCSFNNGDVNITLLSDNQPNGTLALKLISKQPLQGAKIALASPLNNTPPQAMVLTSKDAMAWEALLPAPPNNSHLRLVISLQDALYYGETETTFISQR